MKKDTINAFIVMLFHVVVMFGTITSFWPFISWG